MADGFSEEVEWVMGILAKDRPKASHVIADAEQIVAHIEVPLRARIAAVEQERDEALKQVGILARCANGRGKQLADAEQDAARLAGACDWALRHFRDFLGHSMTREEEPILAAMEKAISAHNALKA